MEDTYAYHTCDGDGAISGIVFDLA